MAAPPRLAGFSLGSIYSSYRTLLLWCSIVFSFGALRLLIPRATGVEAFSPAVAGRRLLDLMGRAHSARHSMLRGLSSRVVCVARGTRQACGVGRCFGSANRPRLLVFGLTRSYSVAAFLLAFGGVALEDVRDPQKWRPYVVPLAVYGGCFVAVVFIINTILAGPFDFRFWQTSLALVSVHRWNEAAPMTESGALHLLLPWGSDCRLLASLFCPGRAQAVFTAAPGFCWAPSSLPLSRCRADWYAPTLTTSSLASFPSCSLPASSCSPSPRGWAQRAGCLGGHRRSAHVFRACANFPSRQYSLSDCARAPPRY